MTYKQIINRFRTIVGEHRMLKDFGYGQLSDLKTQSQLGPEEQGVDYPYLFLLPGTSTRNQSVMNYQFNVIIMDMARGEEGDAFDNYITIQSQCQQYIDDVLARLYYYYRDQPEVTLTGISYTPFKEKYQDELAGMTATVTIQVPTPLNECIAPFEPTYNEVTSVTNTIEYTLGPDVGEDDTFTYNVSLSDPEFAWNLNRYTSTVPGEYEIVVDQNITLNQPAEGEAIPSQPIIYQLLIVENSDFTTTTVFKEYQASEATGWPTEFESTDTVYRYRATYKTNVPTGILDSSLQFMILQDKAGPESTLVQKIGGSLKIGREE